MNPNWLPALATVIGIIVNVVWSAYNVQRKNDLEKLQAEILLTIRREYVPEQVCRERMGLSDVSPAR